MAKVLIFDVARVLLDFEPVPFLKNLIADEQTEQEIINALFHDPRWLLLDRGVIGEAQAIEEICAQHAALAPLLRQVWAQWQSILTPIPQTVDYLKRKKEESVPLYYLSNLHKRTCGYVLAQYPQLWSLFDGGLFSCDTGFIKPQPQLFQLLLERYHLKPAQCIYIDDREENVLAAEALDMAGVVFHSPSDLAKIDALLNK